MKSQMGNPKVRRLTVFLAAVFVFLASVPYVQAVETGTCGENLTWSFDGVTLAISGTGEMRDYYEQKPAPWNSFRNEIMQITLPQGLEKIGNRAFLGCSNVTSISIPGSVKVIGEAAFCENRNMITLTLNEGLKHIGNSAFELCTSLIDLRIPASVEIIGDHAFYCCESLKCITVSADIRKFGTGVFSYCTNLTQVDINTSKDNIPQWSFYGCDNLSEVSVQGKTVDASSFKVSTLPTDGKNVNADSHGQESQKEGQAFEEKSNGEKNYTSEVETVQKTENSTIVENITVTENEDSTSVKMDISAVVSNPEGLYDTLDEIKIAESFGETSEEKEMVDVTLYITEVDVIPADYLEQLAEKDIVLNIVTETGAQYIINCKDLKSPITEDLGLVYSLERMADVPDTLNGCVVYKLVFKSSCAFSGTLKIQIPSEYSRQIASLYQIEKELLLMHSALVDDTGHVQWNINTISDEVEYLIAINAPNIDSSDVLIPDTLQEEYGVINLYDGIQYEITGRKSSWNMGLGKVMAILAVVMVSAIVVVGAVMFFWNKQRLKAGYVPQWDDEEENT